MTAAGAYTFTLIDQLDHAAGADENDLLINLGGVINGVTTLLPRILKHGEGGHIVNTSSMSGMVPVGGTIIAFVTARLTVMGALKAIL